MPTKTLSIRNLSRNLDNNPSNSISIRNILSVNTGRLEIKPATLPFSVICYNVALLPGSIYKGMNKDVVVKELVERINKNDPDVVGLCEVFDDSQRGNIIELLDNKYHHYNGPERSSILEGGSVQDGGLLLLSKFQLRDKKQIVYTKSAGFDSWADKGVIHAKIEIDATHKFNLFLTHAQSTSGIHVLDLPYRTRGFRRGRMRRVRQNPVVPRVDPPYEDVSGHKINILFSQLNELREMIAREADNDFPSIIMGDLNANGEVPEFYSEMLEELAQPVDLWPILHDNNGFTISTDNNFYCHLDETSPVNQRLDYILVKHGSKFVPILQNMDVIDWTYEYNDIPSLVRGLCSGREESQIDISDHFGLFAKFHIVADIAR